MRMYSQTTLLAASGLGIGLTMGACGAGQKHRTLRIYQGCTASSLSANGEIFRKSPRRERRDWSAGLTACRENSRAA